MQDRYSIPESERKTFSHTSLKPNSHVGKQTPNQQKVFGKPENVPKPPMLNIVRDKKPKDQYGSYI